MFPMYMTPLKLKVGDRFKYAGVWYTIVATKVGEVETEITVLDKNTVVTLKNTDRVQVQIKGLLS